MLSLSAFFMSASSHVSVVIVVYQGRLPGVGGEDLPTIVVVAHYDSFGVAPVRSLLLFQSIQEIQQQKHFELIWMTISASINSAFVQR